MANGTLETIEKMLKELGWSNEAINKYFLDTFGVVIKSQN